jgi:hypothetical protein
VSRLAAGDEDWREDMELSTDGVFKSLWAIAFSAPLAVLGVITEHRISVASPNFQETLFAKAPLIAIAPITIFASLTVWLISIAALAFIAQRMGAARNVAGLIVSYNWSQFLVFAVSAAPAAVFALTRNADVTVILYLTVFFFSIFLFWVVLRQNLPIDVGATVALIVAFTLISFGAYELIANAAISLFQLFS